MLLYYFLRVTKSYLVLKAYFIYISFYNYSMSLSLIYRFMFSTEVDRLILLDIGLRLFIFSINL